MKLLPQNDFEYYLTYEGIRTKLVFSPNGWDTDTLGAYKRDETYQGLIRTLSLPLTFALDGFHILREAFIKYGYEARVIFECTKLNRITFIYDTIFLSEFDFSQYRNLDDYQCSIILMEGGFSKEIKAKESTKFEYALTGPDIVNIILPGVVFSEKADSIFLPMPSGGGNEYSDRYMPPIDLVNNDTNSGFVEARNVEQQENVEDLDFSSSGNWFVSGRRSGGQQIRIKGSIFGSAYIPVFSSGSGNYFEILIMDSNNNRLFQIYRSPDFNRGDRQDYNIPFDFTYNLANNQSLFIYVRTDVGHPDLKVKTDGGDLVVSYDSVSDPSNCKGIKAFDLFKRIMTRINPQIQSLSVLMNNDWNNLILTSGNAIRELTDSVIQITFKDYFESCGTWENIGFGVEGVTARIEKQPYFFRNIQIANIGEVKSFEYAPDTTRIFSTLKIGYDDGNTEDIDGQYEYNSRQEYALPVSRVQNDLELLSKIQAAQYKIEKLRRDFIKKSNDTSSDNEVFALDCYLDGVNYRPILGSAYDSVTGMPSPAAALASYNLRMTPKQCLLRQASYLRSILDKIDNGYIQFASAEKNKDLVTVKNGYRVAEKDSVLVSTLSGKYFKPIVGYVTCKFPVDMMKLMDATPYGYILFTFNATPYKGYILETDVDLAKNSEREIQLLMTDDNYL